VLDRRIEYEKMAQVERQHWWYRALHRFVLRALDARISDKNGRILDAGCGTGGLLLFLKEHHFQNLYGYDISPWAIQFCQERGLPASAGDLREPPQLFETGTARAVISNDTLYFFAPGERRRILRHFWEALSPGGLLVLNLPAMRCFRGIHDMSVGIRHRFSKAEVSGALALGGFEVLEADYWPFMLAPVIYGFRFLERMEMAFSRGYKVESDTGMPPLLINRILEFVMWVEGAVIPWRPFGSSVFVVARKR
jgi:SAM-dependent methyltransferase